MCLPTDGIIEDRWLPLLIIGAGAAMAQLVFMVAHIIIFTAWSLPGATQSEYS
jgi:hypothetical protein